MRKRTHCHRATSPARSSLHRVDVLSPIKRSDTESNSLALAIVLRNQGTYDQAESMHRQALRLRKTMLGKEYLDTLTSMYDLALDPIERRRWRCPCKYASTVPRNLSLCPFSFFFKQHDR
jgi:hypothetical protein